MKTPIIGAGGDKGGGGTTRTAQEARDNLQSRASAKLIDLVSEGEIVGLVDGFKSVFLDGTPIENADGSTNFKSLKIETRNGTQAQDHVPGFTASENETVVGVEVKYSAPVVRTITNNSIDAIRVRVSIPQLTQQNTSNGDLGGYSVSYKIQRQSNGGGYQDVVSDEIRGKATSKYERSYRIELVGPGPWDIRVVRLSADELVLANQNKTVWESYTEVIDGKLRYPNSALVAIEIDSSQFSSIPTRGYDIKGLKIKIPSNYDPETREYSGSWDGTFTVAWSDNPAWIFYDILTATRYGLGGFIPEAQVDKWGLYTIGRYCDELVPDGNGGTEPRFTCNTYLQAREEAYKVMADLASVFRGMIYWSGGLITAVQDAPADPAYLFSPANVVDGSFTYQGSSAKARHSVAQVTWNDPEDFYRQKIEYVEDEESIARYGVVETQIGAFACTSRGQANRVGRWLLFSERYQTEIVSFRTGLEGSLCRPGQIVRVADPTRAGERRSGRVLPGSTIDKVLLDQDVEINPSEYSVFVMLPNGEIEERGILSSIGNELHLISSLSAVPSGLWMLRSIAVEPQLFKIIGIAESTEGVHEITALAHNDGKYAAVEQGLKLETRLISSLNEVPSSPRSVKFTETLYEVNGDVRVKVTISWQSVRGASSYQVSYVRGSGNEIFLPSTPTNEIEILNAEPGFYTATVIALNPLNVRSLPATGSAEIIGKARPPGDVQGFSLIPLGATAFISWEKSLDLDVLRGGSVRIRHTPQIANPLWRNSVDIGPALAGASNRASLPLLSGTYMAKFVDSSGNSSVNEAIISTTVPAALALNVVQTIDEGPSFSGARTAMGYSDDLEGLVLVSEGLFDDVEDFDAIENLDFLGGGIAAVGTYEFAETVDLGEVFTSRLTARLLAESFDIADTIDQRTQPIDTWLDFDGNVVDDVNAEILMKTTLDDPADTLAEWTEWKRFFVGEYSFRGAKFKLQATSESADHNIIIKELSVVVDMPDRIEAFRDVVAGALPKTVTFDEPFAAPPSIGITVSNLSTGDYWTIGSKTRSGFVIEFKNAAGTTISKTFDVLAKGYGRQLN